jgi:apolipoprotein N-acyltransferase
MGNDRHMRWYAAWLPAGLAGLAAGVSLPPLGWPWLLWPALAVLWSRTVSPDGCRGGLAWGAAAVLVSHRWLLWLHPLDWIGVPGPLSLPLCLSLWLLVGGLGALLVAGWVALLGRLDATRPATALIGAGLWGLAEVVLARGPLFWLGLGGSALPGDPPLAGLAALGGGGTIAAVQLLVAWCLWRSCGAARLRRRWLPAGALLLLAAHLAGGTALAASPADDGGREQLLVVQPAIPTRRKFEARQQLQLLEQLGTALARAARGAEPAQAVVLPEGALPLGQPLPEAAAAELLSGGFRWDGGAQRSSLLRFAPGARLAEGWVDKHRLVPLGEWVPAVRWLSWSGLSAVGGIEPGPPSRLLERSPAPIGVAICYEIADGSGLAAAVRGGARWLLATANLDPYPAMLQEQFSALARLRAIETGRWLVSAANTGPSLLVDPRGRVRQALPSQRSATGRVWVPHRSSLTAYDRFGEAPLLALLLAGGGMHVLGRR